MPQVLTPAFDLLDRGVGIDDVQASAIPATDTVLQFQNDNNMILLIDNQSVGVRIATLKGKPDPFGRTADEVINIPAGETGMFPFMSQAMFGPGGLVEVELDAVLTTNVLLVRLSKRN